MQGFSSILLGLFAQHLQLLIIAQSLYLIVNSLYYDYSFLLFFQEFYITKVKVFQNILKSFGKILKIRKISLESIIVRVLTVKPIYYLDRLLY